MEQNLCDLYKCNNDGICDLPTESITGYVLYRIEVDNSIDKMMLKCTDNKCLPVTVNPDYYDSAIPEETNEYIIKCITDDDNNVNCDLINKGIIFLIKIKINKKIEKK